MAMHAAAPKEAVIARMGGDEFLAVIPGADKKAAEGFIKKFEKELEENNKREKRSFEVECSCGIYIAKLDEMSTLEHCIRLSDEEMYREKEEHHAKRK